tara:strand:- start:247 stop:492 length:246 start_codon:yes stop_codon:yes gene_type:complete
MKKLSTERLATLVFEKVDRAYEDNERVDVPTLTREIFDLTEEFIPNLVNTPEFTAVCSAVDFLVKEDSVWFDTRDGTVHRV